VSETRTCPGRGLDISDNRLWNSAWGPDMSGPRDLTQDKGESPDMSGITLWNPDKVDWDLAAEELELGRTCPVQEPDMSD
jgi:hypothetical protein